MTILGNIFSYAAAPFSGATSSQDGTPGLVPAPLAGEENYFLRGDGTWAPAGGGGGGDVFGPSSSTDNAIVRFDGTSGKTIQNSVITISDTGAIDGLISMNKTAGNIDITTTTSGNISINAASSLILQGLSYPSADGTTGQVLTTNGSGVLSFSSIPSAFIYVEQTSDTTLANAKGYIVNKGSKLVFTLPVVTAVGEYFEIVGKSASGWQINQNTGQTIYLGGITTTTGNLGYVQSSGAGDSVKIVCVTANTEFRIVSSQGQIELL